MSAGGGIQVVPIRADITTAPIPGGPRSSKSVPSFADLLSVPGLLPGESSLPPWHMAPVVRWLRKGVFSIVRWLCEGVLNGETLLYCAVFRLRDKMNHLLDLWMIGFVLKTTAHVESFTAHDYVTYVCIRRGGIKNIRNALFY